MSILANFSLIDITNAIVYSLMGIGIFVSSFMIIDKITPHDLWRELIEFKNQALATVIAAVALGICIIIAAAIH
jgi:uncharacterized membrane protein YjfL (UPF0719 family)